MRLFCNEAPTNYTKAMPSFFESLRRLATGQPVFGDESQPKSQSTSPPSPLQPQRTVIDKVHQDKFPNVHIKHVKTHENGNDMEVYCAIENTWPEEVMLDKIRILGATREIDDFLRGREEREFLVYRGPKPKQQNYEVQLDYKTRREGDYFRAVHDVRFLYHDSDKTYTINDIRLRLPIRDIYE
jgi:hypothetical protein